MTISDVRPAEDECTCPRCDGINSAKCRRCDGRSVVSIASLKTRPAKQPTEVAA